MAQDTDPGIGVGTPIAGGVPSATVPEAIPSACVSFDRSLEILMLGMKRGAYGLKSPDYCDVFWQVYQREGWIEKLRIAHAEIKRDLGAPICPEAHYDELHQIKSSIRLRQSPVSYLGVDTFTDWTEKNLVWDWPNEQAYIDLCDSDLAPGTISDAQVAYPDAVLDTYRGWQTLQAPVVTRLLGTCGGGTDGYRLTWPAYQLVLPTVDETEISVSANFLTAVKWRISQIDTTLAIEIVGECGCDNDGTYTATLQDATEGIVCLECSSGTLCTCDGRYLRINYATMFGDGQTVVDPGLEQAITLLALTHSHRTPVKPRGCDKTFVKEMLEMDPTAATDFASRLRYGPTVAGMTVMRLVDKYLKRPSFNQPSAAGGLMTGRRRKRTRRDKSFLRGF